MAPSLKMHVGSTHSGPAPSGNPAFFAGLILLAVSQSNGSGGLWPRAFFTGNAEVVKTLEAREWLWTIEYAGAPEGRSNSK